MDALDEETKDTILHNIGELFPNVSDLSFFRQIFDSENWDLEKSLDTIKGLLEYADGGAVDNEPPPNNNTRVLSPMPEPNHKTVAGSAMTSGGSQGGFQARNPAPIPPKMSYSSSIAKAGAVPKTAANEKRPTPASKTQRREKLLKAYNDGLKLKNPVLRIKTFALEGIKVMIIMRGCPGSGKTYLVNHLANSLSAEQSKALGWDVAHPVDHHIFSADEFWITSTGKYVFNAEYIEYAHRWNQKLVRQAASEGRSPIFVDNTHTRLWEMQAVATIAVEFGYIIEIIDTKEVNKRWAFNVNELVRRNVHGVHYDAIKRMVERYELDVQPKHLMRTYNLSYQPNMAPPQRCLVTFSNPPSKNQMKIFNNRFHFVPLKDILALKSEPENPAKTKNAPQLDRVSMADPRYANRSSSQAERASLADPTLDRVSMADPRYPSRSVDRASIADPSLDRVSMADPSLDRAMADPRYLIRSSSQADWAKLADPSLDQVSMGDPRYPNRSSYQALRASMADPTYPSSPSQLDQVNLSKPTYPRDLSTFEQNFVPSRPTDPLHWTGSSQYAFGSTGSYVPPPPAVVLDQPLISPNEYIWSSRFSTASTGSSSASVDHLLSMDEEPAPEELLLPLKNASSDSIRAQHETPTKSGSNSDIIKSFDELSRGSYSKSSSGSSVSRTVCSENTNNLTPSEVVKPVEDESYDSDSSCEVMPMPPPSSACNEFGVEATKDYVLVEPDGNLKFQKSIKTLPVSLKEFVATSKLEKLKKKMAKSIDRNDSAGSAVKLKSFLKTAVDVPKYSDESLLLNTSATPSEPVPNPSVCNVRTGANLGTSGEPASTKCGSLADSQEGSARILEISGMTPQDFINKVWGKSQNNGAAEAKSSGSAGGSSETEYIAPIVESTWIDKEPEPVPVSRSDSPKGQRLQIDRTLKKCDKGTDANYFEIISRANTEALGSDVILYGNAGSFQSSSSPPKQEGVKAVATHEKSSMTKSDESADEIDSGVEVLTKMFPGVSVDCLVDLFEKCQKNLHWTANLLMDSGVEISEDFNAQELPPKASPPPSSMLQSGEASEPSSKESLSVPLSLKKLKKNRYKLTEEHLDLVKEFESNFKLNEEHYSDTLKKVRETKFGRPAEAETIEEPSTSRDSTPPNDPESSSSDLWDDDEGDMNLVVSNDLIGQLQSKFGPIPNIYGSELIMKLPVSLARQIYSYALDSICQQVEDEQNLFDVLIKEDEAFARKLQEESDGVKGAMSFREIMDHELALRAHEREQGQANATSSDTFASRLSHQLLAERFPNMDPVTLQNVLDVTNHSLHEATNLLASAGHVPVEPSAQQEKADSFDSEPPYTMSREESIEQANAYHEVAAKLNDMRQMYFQKAKESYNSGNHAVALFYRELFNWYSEQIKASNAKAAKAMLHGNEGATTLDLHYLHVAEAVAVLDLFLDESIRQLNSRKMEIFIITGRGLHSSDGKSRLKPAIKLRLKQRGLRYGEINPGMLKTVITKSSTVSYILNGVQ